MYYHGPRRSHGKRVAGKQCLHCGQLGHTLHLCCFSRKAAALQGHGCLNSVQLWAAQKQCTKL